MKVSDLQKRVIAIVPAAGLGKRFKSNTNKIYQNLAGKPIIIWTLKALEDTKAITEIIPVLKKKEIEYGAKLIREYGISKVKRIAVGGKERQDSVFNGLKYIDDKNCLVLIHDGARPLIEKKLIEKAIRELVDNTSSSCKGLKKDKKEKRNYDGVILGVPLKDTIKEIDNDIITKTLKRDSIWTIQTPQVFHYSSIFSAYDKAMNEGFYSTDDAALVERYGGRVKVIMGSYRNIKITTQEDLIVAEIFLNKDQS